MLCLNRSGLMFLRYVYIIQLFSKAHCIPMPKNCYDAMELLHSKGFEENLNLTTGMESINVARLTLFCKC